MHRDSPDWAIAAIARRQHGLVTRAQLEEAELGRGSIGHRIAKGSLHPLHAGVYAVGQTALPPHAREMAAVLAYGKGAVISHHSGIPLTAPARTVLDIAADLPPHTLRRTVDEAQVRGLASRAELEGAIARAPNRRGAKALRAVLNAYVDTALTRSEAEERLLALVEAGGLPRPKVNARLLGHEVDFYWPGHKLVVEIDGYAYHRHRSAFEGDRSRDSHLGADGVGVMRFTWHQLTTSGELVLARVAAALATRPSA